MWEQYRRTLVVTQFFILITCAVVGYSVRQLPARGIVLYLVVTFLVMQLGSLLGAWWGARLKRHISSQRDRLPLHKR